MSDNLMRGLALLGIPGYYNRLVRNGIESWEAFILLTEDDLQALDIAPHHRDAILRIKSLLGLSQDNLLAWHSKDGTSEDNSESQPGRTVKLLPEERRPGHQTEKRRYRRHPKADGNAPPKPPTAYVIFANDYRKSLTEERSFTDIAKEVGEAWQVLPPEERSRRQNEADKLRKQYRETLRDYKSTDNYRRYMEYLKRFKEQESVRVKKGVSQKGSAESTTSYDNPLVDASRESQTVIPSERTVFEDLLAPAGFNPDEADAIPRMKNAADSYPVDRSGLDLIMAERGYHQENIEGHLRDLITEEMSMRSADVMDASPGLPKRKSPEDLDLGSKHTHVINPFHFQPRAKTIRHLQSFLHLNGTFFLFDDKELTDNFELAYASNAPLPNRIMTELCLALAIGDQWNESGNDDNCVMWYENGRRYLDDEMWDHDAWVMRAMALICLYHIGARPDTAQHYFHIGLRIAQANGFFDGLEDFVSIEDQDMPTWLRVWSTMKVFYCWFEIEPDSAFQILATFELNEHLASITQWSDAELQEHSAPRRVLDLSMILHAISRDVLQVEGVPLHTYGHYMKKLNRWAATLPRIYKFDVPLNSLSEPRGGQIGETDKLARLHLGTMYLGILGLLLRPLLLKALNNLCGQQRQDTAQDDQTNHLAWTCVQTAANLTEFSLSMLQAGVLPAKSWLSSHFNYDAAIVALLGRLWVRRLDRLHLSVDVESGQLRDEELTRVVSQAMAVMRHCSSREPVVFANLQNVSQLQSIFDRM